MLNELDLLSQNIHRLIELSGFYQRDLLELKQKFMQTCMTLEQIRSEHSILSREHNALRIQHDMLSAKLTEVQVQLKAILEGLPCSQANDQHPPMLSLPASKGEEA